MAVAAPLPGSPGSSPHTPLLLHASTIALNGLATVIVGPSGSGKSALALNLMALGADLVADDITHLWRDGSKLMADAPATIRNKIEARGVGILNARACGPAHVVLRIDMGTMETDRLPPDRQYSVLGIGLPNLHNPGMGCFPAAIMQYLRTGRFA